MPACAFTATVGGAMRLRLFCFDFIFFVHFPVCHASFGFSCVADDTGQSCNNYESQAQEIDRLGFVNYCLCSCSCICARFVATKDDFLVVIAAGNDGAGSPDKTVNPRTASFLQIFLIRLFVGLICVFRLELPRCARIACLLARPSSIRINSLRILPMVLMETLHQKAPKILHIFRAEVQPCTTADSSLISLLRAKIC